MKLAWATSVFRLTRRRQSFSWPKGRPKYPTNTQLWFANSTSYVPNSGKLVLPMCFAKQTTRLIILQIRVILCALVLVYFHFLILCY
ncbi:hypothetical protein LINPERHAP2_LOCUS41554 [Linum perenne]